MYRYGRSKKLLRRSRRLHNEAKDKPRPWWRDEDYEWMPAHEQTARERIHYKRQEQKSTYRRRWMNDFGVTCSARKRKHAAWHERKPYERPTKT